MNEISNLYTKYLGGADVYISKTEFDDFSEIPIDFRRIETVKKDKIVMKCQGDPDPVRTWVGQMYILPIDTAITNLKLRIKNPNQELLNIEISLECGGGSGTILDRVTMDTLIGDTVFGLCEPIKNVDGYTWISLPFVKNSWVSTLKYSDARLVITNDLLDKELVANLDCILFADVLQFQDDIPDYECLMYQNQFTRQTYSNNYIKFNDLPFNHPVSAVFVYVDTKSVTYSDKGGYMMIGDTCIKLKETSFGYQCLFEKDYGSTVNFSNIANRDAYIMLDTNSLSTTVTVHVVSKQIIRCMSKMYGLAFSK
jgi:hypothetical protein